MKQFAVAEYWNEFCPERGIGPEIRYQVWHFGNTPEMALELVQLVISGKKFATASLVSVNELRPEEAPILDGYSVVTDFHGHPMCVVQTAEIRQLPFNEVDAQFAADEGEGDQTLVDWRAAHWTYFAREAAELGLDFDQQSLVCCERFKLLYPR